MPVIREYRQQVSAPGPIQRSEYTADQMGAAEGRALTQAGLAVQDTARTVANRLDQENTSDITAKTTKAYAQLEVELQETIRTAEPGDKKVFEDYNKKVEDKLAEIGIEAETSGARQFYSEASERIKGQLYKTSMQGQAELAGVKAVQDYKDTINSLSAATSADPSSHGLKLELHNQAIDNLVATGQLPRHKALELKAQGETELAKSSIRGWASLDPTYAKKKLASGEFDKQLGAEGKIQLEGEIERDIRAKEVDAERLRVAQERALKKKQDVVRNEFLAKIQDDNLTWKDIKNSILEPEQKEHYLNLIEKKNAPEEKLKTNPMVMTDIYRRIHLPDGDPQKILSVSQIEQKFGEGLSWADMNHLRGEFEGRNTEAGRVESDLKKKLMDYAQSRLVKSNALGLKDPDGEQNFLKFMIYAEQVIKTEKEKGTPIQELFTPDSPKYLGRYADHLQRDNREIMRDMVRKKSVVAAPYMPTANAAPPKPRQKGESIQDYEARKEREKKEAK
jgi:hypothetical protein